MKNRKFLAVTIAAVSCVFTACNDDLETGSIKNPIVEGDEIIFGASDLATFSNGYSDMPQSRTAYGESSYSDGKWHYPLNWVYGDGVSVYCPQASGTKFTHYKIEWESGQEGDIQEDGNLAYMIKAGENGLHWGDTSQSHEFYAFYPSSAIQNDEEFAQGVVHATIPNTQEMEWTQDAEGNWIGKPNMDYAFMRAYNVVTPENAANDRVTLEFTPLTTAVEITLQASENLTAGSVTLSQLQVQAINKKGTLKQTVCGDFTYNINTGVTNLGNPDVANDYMITVPCWHKEGDAEKQVPIELTKGKTLTFTVFLLPRSEDNNPDRTLHNLQVRVPGWNSTARVKTYEGINIAVGTKSQIWLPQYEPLDGANNWIGGLPENVYISQLSIPGSVNAFSHDIITDYSYPKGGKDEMDLTQTLSVEDQFKIGVRAFEIATERAQALIGVNKKNLGTDGYLIAGTTTSSNLHEAMGRLANLVAANPSEFVIAMPYYAPDATDNGEAWSHQLQNYLSKLPTGENGHPVVNNVEIVPFDNSMTIKDAKGKILFLSRMPGSKDNVDQWIGSPQKTTAIYGWDSDKNRWEKRGYDMSQSEYWANGQWNGHGNPMNAGYTRPSYTAWKYEAATPLGNPNFYIQDWFRVCEKEGSYSYGLVGDKQYWYESKTEKENNVKDFMNETIRVLKNDKTGNNVFINSLAGYYIVSKWNGVSAIPAPTTLHPDYGKHGDIPPFARDMNEVVYSYVLGLSYETRGPLGIVLINYAGAPEVFDMAMHGDYIVKALVDNNYRFELIGSQQ